MIDACPQVEPSFVAVLADQTAGAPMREGVRWTDLTRGEISRRLGERGTPAGQRVVRQLLQKHGYVKRQARKKKDMGPRHPDRNAPFENIARLKREHLEAGEPVVSMDTKKKEMLGDFHRAGRLYTQAPIDVFDHDFPSAATGVVFPHGLYDPPGRGPQPRAHQPGHQSRDVPVRLRKRRAMVAAGGMQAASARHAVASAVRRRRQQQRPPLRVQGAVAGPGGSAGAGDSRGPLSAVLLDVQSNRALHLQLHLRLPRRVSSRRH